MKTQQFILPVLSVILIISGGNSFATKPDDTLKYIPETAKVLATKKKQMEGEEFLFIKYFDAKKDELKEKIIDNKGQEVKASKIPNKKASLISNELAEALSQTGSQGKIKVNVALKNALIDTDQTPKHGQVELNDGNAIVKKGNKIITEKETQENIKNTTALLAKERAKRVADRQTKGKKLIALNRWKKNKELVEQIEEGRPTLTLTLTKSEIKKLVATSNQLIDSIEIYQEPTDGIIQAMLDTRVDPHAIGHTNRRGNNIGIYMTESGCANTGHITNYTRLSGPRTNHAENVSGIIRAVSPDSHVYCRGGAVLPSSSDLNGSNGNPQVHIVTRSNGDASSNNYSTLDRDWDNLVYNNKVLSFNSAGNNGNTNDEISSPGKGLNITTIGNYNDANDTIVSSSSANDPQTGNQKPELSGPGTNITAGGHTLSGTSMSTPHAAGFAADLFSAYSWLRLKPAYAKAYIMAASTKSLTGGADAAGVGGLDFYDAYYSGTNTWWEGGNSGFNYFASNDGGSDNSGIERNVYLTPSYGNVRIVFAWLNRGDYTYANRTNAHPIGMDMDISVYGPNGNWVASSASWDNPYEMVNFTPSQSGNYVVKIKRYANRDTASKFHAGLSISW